MNRKLGRHILRCLISGFVAMALILIGLTIWGIFQDGWSRYIPRSPSELLFLVSWYDGRPPIWLDAPFILLHGFFLLYIPYRLYKWLGPVERSLNQKISRVFPETIYDGISLSGQIGKGVGNVLGMVLAVVVYVPLFSIIYQLLFA